MNNRQKEGQIIKWTFELISDEINISADPLWISYNYIYENLSKEVPIKKDKITEVKPVYSVENDTWSEAYNYTTKEIIGYETIYYDGEDRKGLKIGDITINHPNVNVKDNKLVEWYYDIGDRNFPEFGGCLDYEKQKGMCKETGIIELVTLK